MSDLSFTFSSPTPGLRQWDLRGPNGMVRFETADALGFKTASVYVHERVAPAGGELEDCELCGKCWRNALLGIGARSLRAEWEAAGEDDEVIRRRLERWYNEELSTPVPVSEGSQVSGEEVGPGANGPNLAATGAGNGGVVPVPVAAQPDEFRGLAHVVDVWRAGTDVQCEVVGQRFYALADILRRADEYVRQIDGQIVINEEAPTVEPAWGSGPLVDHNPETPAPAAVCNSRDGMTFCDKPASHKGERHSAKIPNGSYTWGYVPTDDELVAGTGSADPDGGQQPLARTQDEIAARITEIADNDFGGFRFEVLACALDFEHVKHMLNDGVTEADWDEDRWHDIADAAQDYLVFAVGKIRDERGLSAERSVIKLREFAWLLGRDDVIAAMDAAPYASFGEPKVRAFAEGMGFAWPEGAR